MLKSLHLPKLNALGIRAKVLYFKLSFLELSFLQLVQTFYIVPTCQVIFF